MSRLPGVAPPRRLAILLIMAFSGIACRSREEPAAGPPAAQRPQSQHAGSTEPAPRPAELKDEIPPAELDAVLAASYRGAGLMEQFEYAKASKEFREVRRRAPGWIPGSINLAIALLNMSGEEAEASKSAGGEAPKGNFDEALELLREVLDRSPDNPHAHFCTGIILQQQGLLPEAYKHFSRVTQIDPLDAAAWYWAASTLTDPANPQASVSPALAKEQAALYQKALDLDPYLTQAIYKLSVVSRMAGDPNRQKALLELWNKINPDRPQPVPGPGNSAAKVYGEMGKYATVTGLPRPRGKDQAAPLPPRFDPARPLVVTLAAGDRWAKPEDFRGPAAVIGRARARFGAAVAAFDADGDGKADLYLAASVVGPKGLRDALLLNRGEAGFEDVTARFGLPMDRASLGVAAADFDADRRVDLFLTGVGKNALLRNRDGSGFEDLGEALKPAGPPAVALQARWLDLDQDGDLDLFLVNHCAAELADKAFVPGQPPPPGIACTAYRNDGQPEAVPGSPQPAWAPMATAWDKGRVKSGLSVVLTPWPDAAAPSAGPAAYTGVAALDVDADRDLDLILAADGAPPVAMLNDRLGRFHAAQVELPSSLEGTSGLLVADLDQDGMSDLVAASASGAVQALRNATERKTEAETKLRFEAFAANARSWNAAAAADLDLDGLPDVVGLEPSSGKAPGRTPSWARNEGTRLARVDWPVAAETPGAAGLAIADLAGDPLPDLLLARDGEPPALALNRGNGHHWLSLELAGHWRVKPELMRTNSHGLGTRVLVEGQDTHVAHEHTTPETGLAQSIGPVVLGLGKRDAAELLHLRWPDGVMQCELNVAADQKRAIGENNRKTGSCPVLFTWDGSKFACLGDFLGGGGLGYLVAPGVYGQPDRDEAVAIGPSQLREEQGAYRLSITEPMDEIAYLDHVRLDVVDSPPGVTSTPDERFAPTGNRPTGELIAWRRAVEPEHATDLAGRDVAEALRHFDRVTVDSFRKLEGWTGYAEEHGIVLDFGDRLSGFGPSDPLVLCLAGWVEYPYSQTNYAAATAGVSLRPPVIERRRGDGSWEVIEPDAGYPAGLPRLTTLDLTGKLTGPSCVLRIRTNMECYYDQAFIAVRDRRAEGSLRVSTREVARAELGHRGYSREVSPDGRLPLLYDYRYVDPAPLARLSGKLTRFGDVVPLLKADDDILCVIGPGDEARLEFSAEGLPPLEPGWTRSFVLRSFGYCKDADPSTALSDTVGPLPWKGMPPFPFGGGASRPADPAYEAYLRDYQTRPAGGGAGR
ncbi:FG-GAP repeat protein [Aquisphaera giovannonii]|uniref:FG-GAP repeat protein n=1 Tax=Aquisphaera giovannonii TaxID=406548 RepID=A0A5B9VX03_9BACT|nr:CRTAC1 family protein [Aquisphaera giovannonii]QEH32798.1 FG-GAP repeat protein [Aquisphaera giovannonii]